MRKPFLWFLLSFFINYVVLSTFYLRGKSFNENRNHHQCTIGTALSVLAGDKRIWTSGFSRPTADGRGGAAATATACRTSPYPVGPVRVCRFCKIWDRDDSVECKTLPWYSEHDRSWYSPLNGRLATASNSSGPILMCYTAMYCLPPRKNSILVFQRDKQFKFWLKLYSNILILMKQNKYHQISYKIYFYNKFSWRHKC